LVLLRVEQLRVQRAVEKRGINCLVLAWVVVVGEVAGEVVVVVVSAGLIVELEELGRREMAALGAELRARRVLERLRCLQEALVAQGGLVGERLGLRGEEVGRDVEALPLGGDVLRAEGGVAGCEGVVGGRERLTET
jgi:hypothetical protein